jgi:hypothetical protein
MKTIALGLGAGIVLAGAAVGLAGPASAEITDGAYLITVTDGHGIVPNGDKQGVFTSSCGPDCTTLNSGEWTVDARLQGNAYSGVTSEGLTLTFDKDSLAGTMFKPETNQTLDVQLSKAAL